MTTPNSIITPQGFKLDIISFTTADAPGSVKTLLTGGVNGSKIFGLWVSNSDAAAHTVQVDVTRASVLYSVNQQVVPALAGVSTGVPCPSFLSTASIPGLPIDADGNPFFTLQSTADLMQAFYASTLAAGTFLSVLCMRGDF